LCSLAFASAAAAREECVTLAADTSLYARPTKSAKVGRTVAAVTAFVERRGAWQRVRLEKVDPSGDYRKQEARVVVHVQTAGPPTRCPAQANIAELGLLREWITLRWKEGGEAYTVRVTDAAQAAGGAKEYIEIEGEKLVCFDPGTFDGVTLTACASCARLEEASRQILGGVRAKICP
jgi:hypothetical protein